MTRPLRAGIAKKLAGQHPPAGSTSVPKARPPHRADAQET